MRASAALGAGSMAIGTIILLASGAPPAGSHQSPGACDSNSLVLTVTKDRTLVRNGDRSNYTVAVANDAGAACDMTGATVTITLPAGDGSPTGEVVTLASGADYPAGTARRSVGTAPYTVAVNPGVTDAVAEAAVSSTLHDAPTDHAARLSKTLGTTVTQPHAALTVAATPSTGQAPLAVSYAYSVTNDSSTDAPLSGVTVSDDNCSPVELTGGDANGNLLLDVGEAWTFGCTRTFDTGGTFTSTATATATNSVDNLPVVIAPAQATVTLAAPPEREVLAHELAPPTSQQARPDAPCVSVPRRLSVRARELTVLRVRVQETEGRSPEGALVRIIGPGFVQRKTTDAQGSAVFRVRPRRSGRLVIQSDRCPGADRVRVRAARRVSSPRVPRFTG